uniref:Putative secreted protein n=1 Tax=Ixodes ricinus TaxID=34613 RepID=A0A147BSC8_IXORI
MIFGVVLVILGIVLERPGALGAVPLLASSAACRRAACCKLGGSRCGCNLGHHTAVLGGRRILLSDRVPQHLDHLGLRLVL